MLLSWIRKEMKIIALRDNVFKTKCEKRFRCEIRDHLSFRSFRMGEGEVGWGTFGKEIPEKITKTVSRLNGIIVLLGASRRYPRKRNSTADYWDEGTRLQDGTRRLARIPERTKNEVRQVGWRTNRLGFHAVYPSTFSCSLHSGENSLVALAGFISRPIFSRRIIEGEFANVKVMHTSKWLLYRWRWCSVVWLDFYHLIYIHVVIIK